MADIFKIGDIVKLNSGGPAMTIISINGEYASTAWFVGRKNEQATFTFYAIHIYKQDVSPL